MARILAVDDQPHLTFIIHSLLSKNGHDVTRVCDGVAALERLMAEKFDVLITDVDMPRMDGLTLLSHREAVDDLCGIIVLTSRDDFRELGVSHSCDRIAFLPKPFSPMKLSELVDRFVLHRTAPSAS